MPKFLAQSDDDTVGLLLDSYLRNWCVSRYEWRVSLQSHDDLLDITFPQALIRNGKHVYRQFFTRSADAAGIAKQIRSVMPQQYHWLSIVTDKPGHTLAHFKPLGYIEIQRQTLMVLDAFTGEALTAPRHKVLDLETDDHIRQIRAADANRVPPCVRYSNPRQFRYYLIESSGNVVCKGRLGMTNGVAGPDGVLTWVAARGRGYATSLVQQMHLDARAFGCTKSVLAATDASVGLYARLGYKRVVSVVMCESK